MERKWKLLYCCGIYGAGSVPPLPSEPSLLNGNRSMEAFPKLGISSRRVPIITIIIGSDQYRGHPDVGSYQIGLMQSV